MGIQDRDVRNAIDILSTEFQNMESTVAYNEDLIKELTAKNEEMEREIESLQQQITELEEALAEAYLVTSG